MKVEKEKMENTGKKYEEVFFAGEDSPVEGEIISEEVVYHQVSYYNPPTWADHIHRTVRLPDGRIITICQETIDRE